MIMKTMLQQKRICFLYRKGVNNQIHWIHQLHHYLSMLLMFNEQEMGGIYFFWSVHRPGVRLIRALRSGWEFNSVINCFRSPVPKLQQQHVREWPCVQEEVAEVHKQLLSQPDHCQMSSFSCTAERKEQHCRQLIGVKHDYGLEMFCLDDQTIFRKSHLLEIPMQYLYCKKLLIFHKLLLHQHSAAV